MEKETSNRFPIIALLGILTGIYLSVIAAWFSIVGMMALFSASAISVCLMMVGLETAKIIASCSLKFNKTMKLVHRLYIIAAVAILMTITAIGVYGFLAKGHLEQQAPLGPIQLQIAQGEARIDQLKQQLTGLNAQQQQMNASVDALIRSSQSARDARTGLRARSRAAAERKAIDSRVESVYAEINQISQQLVPLKMKTTEVTAKLGPIQYIADAFGWKDPETAVRIIILMLMAAFDPLAIVLLIVGAEKMDEWSKARSTPQTDEPEGGNPSEETTPEPEPTPEPAEPATYQAPDEPVVEPVDFDMPIVSAPSPKSWAHIIGDPVIVVPPRVEEEAKEEPRSTPLLPELEDILQAKKETDKDQFVEILERNPEFIEEVVNAAQEAQDKPKSLEWLSPPPSPQDKE